MKRRDECAVCGRPEPFGTNLCPRCGASSQVDDALLFVRGTPDRSGPREAEARLASLTGDAVVRRVARGTQPLLRLPASVAPRVVERLEAVGVIPRIVPTTRAWTAMPAHFFVMLLAILSTGALAGLGPMPMLLWTSPLFTAALLFVAQRSMNRPALGNARHVPRLPGFAASAVRQAFAELSDGTPRERLADMIRVAQPVFAGAPRDLGSLLSELVVAACGTALETDRQTAVLEVLGDHTDNADVMAAATRCERSRRVGIELLERAETAVARLGATHSLHGLDVEQRPLAELVQELEREAQVQAEAARDLKALLTG